MNLTSLLFLFSPPTDPTLLVYGNYSTPLVLLAIAMAVFASWMALQMAGQARRAASRGLRATALATGSVALGAGVWGMHFIGMLAFRLCTPVEFDPVLTAWSMLPSLGASFVALWLISQRQVGHGRLSMGAVLVGLGIGAMHYAGMAAMRTSLLLYYDPWCFVLSIVVAVVLARLALGVRFGLVRSGLTAGQRLLAASVVMGGAITGMHFMGMAAARFVGTPLVGWTGDAANGTLVAVEVAIVTVAFTTAAAALNIWLRYRETFRRMNAHEAQEQALLAQAADGVLTLAGNGVIVNMNAAAERLFGCTRREMLGHDCGSLLAPADEFTDAANAQAVLEAARTDPLGRSMDMLAVGSGGRRLQVRVNFSPRQSASGDQCIVVIRDMTERRAMQQALEASERQLRTLVGSIPGIAYRLGITPGWPMLYMSEAAESVTGCPAADFVGTPPARELSALILAEDRERTVAEVRQAVREGRPHLIEFRVRRPDGSIRWLWSNGRASGDTQGQAQWIDGVILDITERKEAELALQHFQALVEESGDAIFATTAEGVLTSWNKGAEKVWGYTAQEALGNYSADLMANPAAPQEPRELRDRALRGERIVQHVTQRRRKDGSLIDISATISPIRGPDGNIVGISLIARDITERRRMEADLLAAKEAAELAVEARTAFLANMSHEIRTPMNAVLGFTEVLLGTPLDAQQRRHLDIIRDSGRSLLHLLNQVLDLAKLDRGAAELEAADFDLLALIDGISSTMGHSARAKGLPVQVEYAPGLATARHGDELRLRQILTNLLGNAIKFTAQGSVTLTVAGGSEPEAPIVHFTVRDTGIGIAPDRIHAIFDPFTQADASMSRRYGGTGLGTTIAKQLTELMGGRIWAESTEGVGSAFHVVLPLAPAHGAIQPAVGARLPRLKPLRLLAADDVPQNLELLSLLLQDQGHEVVQAGGGAQAVARAAQEHFDAVLLDVHMPDMDGLSATRLIRAAEIARGAPHVPVVALTASVRQTDLMAARAAGMDGFAAKPIELPALLAELARVLGVQAQADDEMDADETAATQPAARAAEAGDAAMNAAFHAGAMPAMNQPAWVIATEMAARPPRAALPVEGEGPAQIRERIAAAPVLDYAGGLRRCGGREGAYLRMLGRFTEQYAGSAQEIVALAHDGDAAAARAGVHRLRGVAANLGLQALWTLSGALEDALDPARGSGGVIPAAGLEGLLALLAPCNAAALQAIAAARAARAEALPAAASAAVMPGVTAATPAHGAPGIAQAAKPAVRQAVRHGDIAGQSPEPFDEAQIGVLGRRLLRAFARGQFDEHALARLLAALEPEMDPADRAGLQYAVDNFDFPLASSRLAALLAACGSRRAESTL